MMWQFLSKVEDTFLITDRGLIIVPGIPRNEKGWKLSDGEPLELRRPDGTSLQTTIAAIELGGRGKFTAILLPRELTKDDVPIGTEVWVGER